MKFDLLDSVGADWLIGMPVILSPMLTDGEILFGFDVAKTLMSTSVMMIGTRPLTDLKFAGPLARHIVQQGLADVLEWCGLKADPPPRQSGKGLELYEQLRERVTS